MGKFDDSIAQYRKALEIEPSFVNAHQGIAMDLLYQGKPKEAAAELQTFTKKARTDAERRTALFALTVVHVDAGQTAKALADVEAQYALGEKTKDAGAMAGDSALRGNILLEAGKPDAAKAEYDKAVNVVESSNLSPELKANTKLIHHYNLTLVAVAKKDLAAAKREAGEYGTGASVSKNPFQRKFPHELAGIIALAEKDWDKALAELPQANLQNPYNLYRIGLAYRGKGDAAKAKEFFTKAAEFNSLPGVNYAFIRTKAKAAAAMEDKTS
jgi:tetratricopeptide (TPR) repeat protein